MNRKCKVIEIFKLSWGTVVVLEFFEPTHFEIGDKLESSNGHIWTISRITKGKPIDTSEVNLSKTINQWDCTIEPVGYVDQPIVGEELSLLEE